MQIYKRLYPPLIGGMRATVSPSLRDNTSPAGTYSSFNARVMLPSSITNGANLGYVSANIRRKSAVLGDEDEVSSLHVPPLLLSLVTLMSVEEHPAASRDEAKKRTFTFTLAPPLIVLLVGTLWLLPPLARSFVDVPHCRALRHYG